MKLKILFKAIINEIITIELKNGTFINGLIVEIDKNMNMYFKHAKRTQSRGKTILLDEISVRGNKIRYIVLPTWFNLDSIFIKT